MKISYHAKPADQLPVDVLVLFCTRTEVALDAHLGSLDDATNGAVARLVESGEFTGRSGQLTTLHGPNGWQAKAVILTGLGDEDVLNADTYRRACGRLARHRTYLHADSVALHLGPADDANCYQATVEGLLLGGYRITEFKGHGKTDFSGPAELHLAISNARLVRRLQSAVERGQVYAEGQMLARTLATTPANLLTPSVFADRARSLGRQAGIKVQVLDSKRISDKKMGALMSVAKGSDEEPRFVILNYNGAAAKQKPVVLVGKGITFDSGGLSLKKPDLMPEMKGDMAGAGIVLATMLAAAKLGLKLNLVGLMPLAENMPSAKATRPGDIITSRKGLTIEILNTDAEGRLILADALDFASEFDPQAVIDIATLTGGSLYVLGYSGAPIMGNHPKLMDRLREAADLSAERVWEMPIWDDFRNAMKSQIADLTNSGGRAAATMTAGAFLESFIGDWPWAHIDIAYVDVEPKGRPYIPKGTTGVGVRLLLSLLDNWKKL